MPVVRLGKANVIDSLAVERELPIPCTILDNKAMEMPVPEGRPDIMIDLFNFELDIHDEGYRYHCLPIGVLG